MNVNRKIFSIFMDNFSQFSTKIVNIYQNSKHNDILIIMLVCSLQYMTARYTWKDVAIKFSCEISFVQLFFG